MFGVTDVWCSIPITASFTLTRKQCIHRKDIVFLHMSLTSIPISMLHVLAVS